TLSIDVTIDQFNHILSQFSNESGELFLFNNNQQLLAAPKIVSSKDNNILNIKNVFSKKFIESMNRSAKVISTSDSLSSSDKYYILVSNFPDFDATLLYRIKKTELWWKIIDQTKIFLILFFIGVLLVFRNVLNMLKINIQQKDLEKSEALLKETQKISKICSWEFNSLTNELIFSENVNFFFPALKIENIASLENIKQWVTEDYQNSWEKHLVTSISQEQEVHFEGVLNPSLTNLSSKVEKIASLVARSQKTEPNHFILRGTIQDITQRKELENIIETERAMNVQNSKLAALGEMSANIAHEINNPLAIIVANTHRLKKSIVTSTPEQVSVILNTIESMSKRISSTIKGLRAFSRDAHNDPLQKYQLNNLISDVLIITQERFKVSNIHFSYPENIPDNILLECNPTQISQVLINLLMNSFDSISTLDDKWVKLEVKITDTRIDFIVTDSGKGIDKDIADKIFQPFFSTKEVGKGTGIGLSISKGLIEAHNGHIFLDSSSQNTRFVIQLPRNKTGDIS
ncbi:MAG: hypothetical protein KDD45_05560, partial [Bdellovibrionales bacterium]|nr:hypothetical protein [Bdellovibrionales bacterium]